MRSVIICFQVHHPYHTRWYLPRDGHTRELDLDLYFDMQKNFESFSKLWNTSYLPTINALLTTIRKYDSKYAVNLSGIFLEQCRWNPEITVSFKELASTGNVEFICSPYYNSISSLFKNVTFFKEQVMMHKNTIQQLFGIDTTIFMNSDLLCTPTIESLCCTMGFDGMITEGASNLLNGRQPTGVFTNNTLAVLTRHIDLSEDIEKRFSTQNWVGYPLNPEKFASWIRNMDGDVTLLYIDCATFGGHHNAGAPIFDFLEQLPLHLEKNDIDLITPSEAIHRFDAVKLPGLQTENLVKYGMSNLLGNHMQHMYFHELNELGHYVEKTRDPKYRELFGYLQQVDILSSMNSHNTPMSFEMAVNNFSILSDFKRRLIMEGA
ncbi:MAG: alpha-amylase [ANME-2 cluster archaeon]|nr:alpha-amylase [ANME-2 cluster archaeon]